MPSLNNEGKTCNTAALPFHTSPAFKHKNSMATNICTCLVLQYVVWSVLSCKLSRCFVHSYVLAYDMLTQSRNRVLWFSFTRAVSLLFSCLSLSQLSNNRNLIYWVKGNASKFQPEIQPKPLCNRNDSLTGPSSVSSWANAKLKLNWLLLQIQRFLFFAYWLYQ